MTISLNQLEAIPEGFLDATPQQLPQLFPGPTLLHLKGACEQTLLVSILIHGNETSGLTAVQRLLKKQQVLPRSLSIFVGNVHAAAMGVRSLPGQSDYNRIWPDAGGRQMQGDASEQALAREVCAVMREHALFAVVDIHNNSGRNPAHACVNLLEDRHIGLAGLFSDMQLYFTYPPGTLSQAFTNWAPTVTIECGLPGDVGAESRATALLDTLLEIESIPAPDRAVAVYRSVATVSVPDHVEIGGSGLTLSPDLDQWNWRTMPEGTVMAQAGSAAEGVLIVTDAAEQDVTGYYLRRDGDKVVAAKPLIPAMISLDTRIIRQDCLCYLLEPVFK